jgi:hypothetical protein
MITEVGNSRLMISWRYHWINPKTGKEYNKRWTRCIIRIWKGEKYEILAQADAKCFKRVGDNKIDVFNKCIGRKLSLQRALHVVNNSVESVILIDKDTRKKIWEQYTKEVNCNFEVSTKKPRKEEKVPILHTSPDFTL